MGDAFDPDRSHMKEMPRLLVRRNCSREEMSTEHYCDWTGNEEHREPYPCREESYWLSERRGRRMSENMKQVWGRRLRGIGPCREAFGGRRRRMMRGKYMIHYKDLKKKEEDTHRYRYLLQPDYHSRCNRCELKSFLAQVSEHRVWCPSNRCCCVSRSKGRVSVTARGCESTKRLARCRRFPSKLLGYRLYQSSSRSAEDWSYIWKDCILLVLQIVQLWLFVQLQCFRSVVRILGWTSLLVDYQSVKMSESAGNGGDSGGSTRSTSSVPVQGTPSLSGIVSGSAAAVLLQMPWSSNKDSGLPFFNGKNVTRFLNEFDRLAAHHRLTDEERAESVVRFCGADQEYLVRNMPEHKQRDWSKLKEEMLREWEDDDEEQMMLTIPFLEALAQKERGKEDDIRLYLRQFKIGADHLIKTNQQSSYQCGRLFLQGMPEQFRRKIVKDLKINHRKPQTVEFEKIYKKGVECWESEYNSSYFNNSPSIRTFTNLVERRETNPSVMRAKERKERRQGEEGKVSATSNVASSLPQAESKELQPQQQLPKNYEEQLVRQFEKLALPISAAVEGLNRAVKAMTASAVGGTQTGAQGECSGGECGHDHSQGAQGGRRGMSCYFCGGPHLRNACPDLKPWFDRGLIHINGMGNITLGP